MFFPVLCYNIFSLEGVNMIKFDFNSMDYIDNNLLNRKEEVKDKFKNSYMIGWTKRIDNSLVEDIIRTANEVKTHSDCLVVIGIGGSFLGSLAVEKALAPYFNKNKFEVIYAGNTLSSDYMDELVQYLKDKDFTLNVISKSGTTLETTITYTILKKLLVEKYDEDQIKKHLIITTDLVKGSLREEVNTNGYKSFPIPDDIGGRYSIMTSAHLFPLAFNIDINEFICGYYEGAKYDDSAFYYAVARKSLFERGKVVENFVVFEEKLSYFSEWLKQLFGETEGKEEVGIFPTSTVYTRDLHSLGQFIQEGNKILFETFIKVESGASVAFKKYDLHDINNIVLDSVRIAHKKGDVSSFMITVPKINEKYLGQIMYFFMLAASYSGLLFNVDPFNQPGVEVYKKEVRDNIKF